jgi:hypothetical protein
VADTPLPRQQDTVPEIDEKSIMAEDFEPTIRTSDGIQEHGLFAHEVAAAIGAQGVGMDDITTIEVEASVAVDSVPWGAEQANAVSSMPSSPTPDQPQKTAATRKRRAARPFRLFLISLILIGVVAILAQKNQPDDTPALEPMGKADLF